MQKQSRIINVVDVEATCFDETTPQWTSKDSEVIQVGVAKIDVVKLAIIDKLNIYIKPIHTPVTKFCTDLTGITPERLESEGVTFQTAVIKLENFGGKISPWASYGDYDNRIMNRNAKALGLESCGLSDRHINIKLLGYIMNAADGLKAEMGLSRMLKHLGMSFEGTPHDGLDDAVNAAKVFLELIR